MKTKIIVTIVFAILIVNNSCDLQNVDYTKITPDTFYKTPNDAKLAVAALYNGTRGMFGQANTSYGVANDVAAGDMMMGVWGASAWEGLFYHNWSQVTSNYTNYMFPYYTQISTARIVAKQIAAMTIPDAAKNPLSAEANTMAGWVALMLYDWHGPVPYPSNEDLSKPAVLNYPPRPTNEEFVQIIEGLLSNKSDLMNADFGANFGRINLQIADMILMKLYMLEAGRTGDANFWSKAQSMAEEIINSGFYTLQKNYNDVFSIAGRKNHEIIFAPASDYSFGGNIWHTEVLGGTFPCKINTAGSGTWAVNRLIWAFYDTFNKSDLRLSGIPTSYISTPKYGSILIDRTHPFDIRQGIAGGPFPVKYEVDPNPVGSAQAQDFIIYRLADVILSMAEILNELGNNANVNAPVMTQVAKDGTPLQSDGGKTPYSFINAIRVRAGLIPLSGLSKSQLRDSILMERSHELYCEGTRRTDLIRYQRVTNGQGYKVFDVSTFKFLMPIPNIYINEFKGNVVQNPGY
jgi:starch-binding outer membrane protein, SusD/RagB family